MAKQALPVSIVIPVYNEEHHLAACLEAIAQQTVKPAEVIVVDNNSTDRTPAIAKRYKFVTLIKEPVQGVRAARQTGLNRAKSPLIGRIDADTRLPDDWVAKVQKFYRLPGNEQHALAGSCYFYNVRWPRFNRWISSQFVFRMNRLMVGHYILWGANMALPKKLWQKVEPQLCQRDDIHEDLDIAIHLHQLGYQISYRSDLVVGARMGRVFEDHKKLWPYLMLWPRTLKSHHVGDWPLSYIGSVFLFAMQVVPQGAEIIGRWFGRPRLNP